MLLDQEFAEPVAVSSTTHADFPLPRTVYVGGFDLLPLRARRKGESRGTRGGRQGPEKSFCRYLRKVQLSTFPQPFLQHVEESVDNRQRSLPYDPAR